MIQLETPASTIEIYPRRAPCELCDRLTLPGNTDGLCPRCRARLATLRGCPTMQAGARVAAVLALRGPLARDLVCLRLAQAAHEGRLAGPLAEAAGAEAGRFACKVCGMLHRLEAGAASCCAALPRPTPGDDPGGLDSNLVAVAE